MEKRTVRRASMRLIGVAAMGTAATMLALFSGTAKASTSITYDEQYSVGTTVEGNDTLTQGVTATAPSTVSRGSELTSSVALGAFDVPTTAHGYTVDDIQDFSLSVPVPANSTYASCSVSGGSNYGSGTPACSENNGVVQLSVPGPFTAGSTVTLPTLNLTLFGSGMAGSKVQVYLGGTSYADPGVTFTTVIEVNGSNGTSPADVTFADYPNPNPVLSTTTIECFGPKCGI